MLLFSLRQNWFYCRKLNEVVVMFICVNPLSGFNWNRNCWDDRLVVLCDWNQQWMDLQIKLVFLHQGIISVFIVFQTLLKIWQAAQQHCCRGACQISKQYELYNTLYRSLGFCEILRSYLVLIWAPGHCQSWLDVSVGIHNMEKHCSPFSDKSDRSCTAIWSLWDPILSNTNIFSVYILTYICIWK